MLNLNYVYNLKKTISILFLFIFIYNLLGYYTVFKIFQAHVRYEVKLTIKHSVPDDELVLISVKFNDKSKLTWFKPGKEFRYQGEMYDVVRKEIKNGYIVYYCISDTKENNLFKNLDEHIQNYIAGNSKEQEKTGKILNELIKVYLFQTFKINKPLELTNNTKNYNDLTFYKSIILDVLSPPPNLFSTS